MGKVDLIQRIQLDVGRLQLRTLELHQQAVVAIQEEIWPEAARIMRELESIYRKEWADHYAYMAEQIETTIASEKIA